MRILIIAMNYHPEPSGTAPYTTGLAEYLVKSGHHVEVYSGLPHYPEWEVSVEYRQNKRRETIKGVHVRRFSHHVPKSPARINRLAHEASFAAQILSTKVRKADAVVSVSPPLFGAAAAMRVAKKLRVPLIVVVQDIYATAAAGLGTLRSAATALAQVEKSILHGADKVITINNSFRAMLGEMHSIDSQRIEVVRNWSNIEFIQFSDAERVKKRQQLGWEGKVVMLHAGNMGEKQGLDILVKQARGWDARKQLLVLLGGGNQKPSLVEKSRGCDSVSFLGSVDDTEYAQTLNASDLLVVNEQPGVSQMSMPSKVSSYFAASRPVVACTDAEGELGRLLGTEGIGRVILPGDMDAFERVIEEYRTSPTQLLAQKDRARAWAEFNVRPQPILESYRTIIEEEVAARSDWASFQR